MFALNVLPFLFAYDALGKHTAINDYINLWRRFPLLSTRNPTPDGRFFHFLQKAKNTFINMLFLSFRNALSNFIFSI